MIFLKWYLIVCAAMMLISYLRVWGVMVNFFKRHPNAIFKKSGLITRLFNIINSAIYFIIPVVNLITFIGILITSDKKIENVIIAKCERI